MLILINVRVMKSSASLLGAQNKVDYEYQETLSFTWGCCACRILFSVEIAQGVVRGGRAVGQ